MKYYVTYKGKLWIVHDQGNQVTTERVSLTPFKKLDYLLQHVVENEQKISMEQKAEPVEEAALARYEEVKK